MQQIKMKCLFLTFGFDALLATCKFKNWRIPTIKEVKDYTGEIEHDWIRVIDKPTYDNEDGTRSVLYNKKLDKTIQVHKNFMEHACIIKGVLDGDID